jgi:hypothetical protein
MARAKVLGAREIDGGEDAFVTPGAAALVPYEAMSCSSGIEVDAHDPAAVVDAVGHGSGPGSRAGIGVIDRGEDAVVQQKAANRSFGIDVPTHDLAAAVDAEDRGLTDGIGVIDGGEDVPVQNKAVADERGRVAVVAGAAHHHLHSA